jgi:AAA15 family ATPase/GTPase
MLLKLKIKNFLSFYKETAFDMFSNIKREKFSHHIHTNMEVPLLKQAAIYGANASGKSNFIKAVTFLREFITNENFLKFIDLDNYIFQLTKEKSQTISFEIEFFYRDKYYRYNADISPKKIAEKLSISGLGKTDDQLIFARNGPNINSPFLQNEKPVKQLLALNPNSSLLPLNLKFPVFTNTDVKHAYDWFSQKMGTISINTTIPILINLMSQKPELLNFANTVFERMGMEIKTMEISHTPFDQWATQAKNASQLQKIMDGKSLANHENISPLENNKNSLNMTVQRGVKTVQEFLFTQIGLSGCEEELKISAQSDGTVRILTLIPALYGAMFEEQTIFIDEIDQSIHPNLMYNLLKFYADNSANGQLIFTTHTSKLLNQQELLRLDEVWFAEKTDGNTGLYSLNDFRLHNTLNIENGYLNGRYGGVPLMEELEIA